MAGTGIASNEVPLSPAADRTRAKSPTSNVPEGAAGLRGLP
jgi:hypothetical protein